MVRVVIAPDKFAGTLTAVQAATAMAEGWQRGAPHDTVVPVPMSDGGPGFVDVVHAALGGQLLAVTVAGPLGAPVPATVLLVDTDAYVESAQACGLELVPVSERDIWRASTFGVGELVAAAVDAGARRVHVGLGGSVTNDGGAGLLAALGAEPAAVLGDGPRALAQLDHVDLAAAIERVAGVELVVASDVDNPLLGLRGASNVYAAQKGANPEDLPALDAALSRLAELAEPVERPDTSRDGATSDVEPAGPRLADAKGAGSAGGLGYGLLLLGGRRVPGFTTVADIVGLPAALRGAGLVLTGEGAFDWQSMRGKVVSGVAAASGEVGAACVVLAGRVDVGRREMNANGVEAAYALANLPGGLDAALQRPAETLELLAERTARSWSPPPRF